jgi:Tfp pilus assembly protein PilV
MSAVRQSSSIAGFTVVEVLVAVALFGLITVAVAMVLAAFLKNTQQTSLRITRDQVVNQLRMTLNNSKAIVNSLKKPENLAFHNCLCGIGTCKNMEKVATGDFLPFSFYDVSDSKLSTAFYDTAGIPCDPIGAQCLIRVKTTFFAQCLPDFTSANQNPPSSCDGTPAEFVAIVYTVDENPATLDQQSLHLKPISGPVYIQPKDLPAGSCP